MIAGFAGVLTGFNSGVLSVDLILLLALLFVLLLGLLIGLTELGGVSDHGDDGGVENSTGELELLFVMLFALLLALLLIGIKELDWADDCDVLEVGDAILKMLNCNI